MRFRFEMPGDTYSKNKESFKRILARHGLRWRGSLDRPFWASGSERVTALFDRDQEKDVLRNATLVWESAKKSTLLEDLKAWAWEVGAKAVEDRAPSAEEVTDEVEQALRYWDIVWKPNVDFVPAPRADPRRATEPPDSIKTLCGTMWRTGQRRLNVPSVRCRHTCSPAS